MKFQFQKTKISAFLASLKIQAKSQTEQTPPETQLHAAAVLELETIEAGQRDAGNGRLSEMLGAGVDMEYALPVFGNDIKKYLANIVKTIGARFGSARELTNLSQSFAAKRLGCANSSNLAA